jgi:hypothetical protein
MPKGLSAVGAKYKDGQKGAGGIKELSVYLDNAGLPIIDPKKWVMPDPEDETKMVPVEPFIMRFIAPGFSILEPDFPTLAEAAKSVPAFKSLLEYDPSTALKLWQAAACYLPDEGETESALSMLCGWQKDDEMAPLVAYITQGFRGLFPSAFQLGYAVGEAKNDSRQPEN